MSDQITVKGYRFEGRAALLTYPRCNRAPAELARFLRNIERISLNILGLYIVSEAHEESEEEEEENHLHALVLFNKKMKVRNFDKVLQWDDYRVDIRSARTPADALTYLKKAPLEVYQEGDLSSIDQDCLKNKLLGAGSRIELKQLLFETKQMHRFRFWEDWWSLAKEADLAEAEVRPITSFINVPQEVWDWHGVPLDYDPSSGVEIEEIQTNPLDHRALVLVGDAGSGKTCLARSLAAARGDFLWVTERQALKSVALQHRTIVFDDADFGTAGRTTLINLLDTTDSRRFRVLYGDVAIGRGVRRIFTTNRLSNLLGEHEHLPEIQRRIRVVRIMGRKLYADPDGGEGGQEDSSSSGGAWARGVTAVGTRSEHSRSAGDAEEEDATSHSS
jgi:hypothetical protein